MSDAFYLTPSEFKTERPLTEITGNFVILFQSCLADFRARGGRVIESWSHQRAPPINNCTRNCVGKVATTSVSPFIAFYDESHVASVWSVLYFVCNSMTAVGSIQRNKLRCKHNIGEKCFIQIQYTIGICNCVFSIFLNKINKSIFLSFSRLIILL